MDSVRSCVGDRSLPHPGRQEEEPDRHPLSGSGRPQGRALWYPWDSATANRSMKKPALFRYCTPRAAVRDSRMDRCRKNPQRMAIRKAYTCALSGQDSKDYAARLKEQGRTVAEMGDPMLAAVQGGVVVLHPQTGAILGGIGVSGLAAQEDEDIANMGLKALGL